jgi:hypothetical protein
VHLARFDQNTSIQYGVANNGHAGTGTNQIAGSSQAAPDNLRATSEPQRPDPHTGVRPRFIL